MTLDMIAFGGDYNPEQWPRHVWVEDIELMQRAGVNLVSLGIFSWALLEPREGEFHFEWLDDIIAMLHEAGIGVSLATPTASPPAWFWKRYPEARPVNRQGVPLGFGSRGMASPSSPEYAAACARITRALAERYGLHPAVRLWHVHNEYGAPITESYDTSSVAAFRSWLEHRYGGLDELNASWGTTFWGQTYGEWDEIDAPREAASTVNPAQRLDFARFSNHALLECFRRERDIIRELSPGIPITTNFMATNCLSVDYWTWAHEVDVVANDHYLVAERDDNHVLLALDADLTRSLANGSPWLLMEHSTSAVNWQPRNIAKRPGELLRNSLAHFARGAEGIQFFQWRASRFGAEKFHSAMVPHGGADTAIFRDVTELGRALQGLDEMRGSRIEARVAILWDWESFWAQDLEWRPSVDLSHRRQIETFYTRLWRDGIQIDFVHPESPLSGYDLVIAPSLYLLSATGRANLESFVRRGGVFVASYFSGIVDVNDTIPGDASPGALRELLGLRIEEFRPLRGGEHVEIGVGGSPPVYGTIWTDEITLESATSIADYLSGPAAGRPAITRNQFGDGSAWYFSTELDVDALGILLSAPFEEAGVVPHPLADAEHTHRYSDVDRYTTVINHGERTLTTALEGRDLLSGETSEAFEILPGAVRIVQSKRKESDR